MSQNKSQQQDQRASALGPHQHRRPHTRSPANIISAHPKLRSRKSKLSSTGVVAAMSTQPSSPTETGRAPANADTGKRGDANSFNGAVMVVRDTPDAIGESPRAGDEAPNAWSPGSGPSAATSSIQNLHSDPRLTDAIDDDPRNHFRTPISGTTRLARRAAVHQYGCTLYSTWYS